MKDSGKLLLRTLLEVRDILVKRLLQIFQVGRAPRFLREGVQLLEDTPLHLVGGLIGEGDGQYMPIGVRTVALHEQPDVFLGQVVCLAGPRRRLQNPNHA